MTTFHTDHGTVRYSGIRRFIVVSDGKTVKRTDSFETAHKVASNHAHQGATIVDTLNKSADETRICRICRHATVLVESGDFAEFGAHWGCLNPAEREAISRRHRKEAGLNW